MDGTDVISTVTDPKPDESYMTRRRSTIDHVELARKKSTQNERRLSMSAIEKFALADGDNLYFLSELLSSS